MPCTAFIHLDHARRGGSAGILESRADYVDDSKAGVVGLATIFKFQIFWPILSYFHSKTTNEEERCAVSDRQIYSISEASNASNYAKLTL